MKMKDLISEKKLMTRDEDPCWSGYRMYGTKKKGGKEVPNCVPENDQNIQEDLPHDNWYDQSTQELIDRVRAGEHWMDVVNDLARQYAASHGDDYDAFDFAADALGRRAWEMGLKQDDSEQNYRDINRMKKLAGLGHKDSCDGCSEDQEIYHGDEFYEAYGELGYSLDQDDVFEAEYQGRKVKLNKPMRGDVKKFKVFVRDPGTGNVKKVNFGDPDMRIRKSDPQRRKSFRARHNCDNPGPKTKARYWSCKKW